MKTLTNVKSQTRPVEIDDFSSDTTVFVRQNIKESVETDPVFGTKNTVYIYDEIQYTYPEWTKLVTDGIRVEGTILQEQIDITQLAMSEIIGLLAPVAIGTFDLKDTEVIKLSAIAMMYIGMIKRGLITIDKVPEPFRTEVEQNIE